MLFAVVFFFLHTLGLLLSRVDVKDTVKVILGVPFANSRLFNEHLTLKTKTKSQFCVSDVKDTVKVILGVPFANSRLFNEHLTLKTKTKSQFCVSDVKDTVKVILGVPFANSRLFNEHLTLKTKTKSQFCVSVGCDGFHTSVSGRIDSSVISLFRLPPVSLSFLFSPSFLPSLRCNKFVGRRTQNKIPVTPLPCVFYVRVNYLSLVRDLPSSNMLEGAISVSLFRSTSQTRSCALRMPWYVAFITFTVAKNIIQYFHFSSSNSII